MKRKRGWWLRVAALLAALVAASGDGVVAGQMRDGVYIILDASGSMWGVLPDGSRKIEAARAVLDGLVAGDFGGRDVALRAYGHRREADCADTELVVPFAAEPEAVGRVRRFGEAVNPKGKTPIGRSLRAALEDFGDRRGEIILISDGIETCDDDPCALVKAWREEGVAIKVHVVGLGLDARERAAMKCISDAAGTPYHDAGSATELASGLAQIQERPSALAALVIKASNAAGDEMIVRGTATPEGGAPVEVASHRRNRLPSGDHLVTVGVETRNGQPFEPVTRKVTVAGSQDTVLEVEVVEPPSVQAKFVEAGQESRGSQVGAYQGGREAFSFRWIDRVYVDPGTYEFRARPNAENELKVTRTIAAGERADVVFELAHTVHAVIKMVASGSGLAFRQNYELWQDSQKVGSVHWSNGVRARPGRYEVRLPSPLTPYATELTLTAADEQDYRLEVPVGHATIVYQKADGTRDKDERCFLERWDGKTWVAGPNQRTGQAIALTPNRYRVKGWSRMGNHDAVEFAIARGDEKQIELRDRK